MAKQPPVKSMPNVPVEVAVCAKRVKDIPPARVLVPVPATLIIEPTESAPVVEALLKVARRPVKFCRVEEPETKRLPVESCDPTFMAPVVEALVKVALPVRSDEAKSAPCVLDPLTYSAVVVAPVKVAFVNVAFVPWMFVAVRRLSAELQVKVAEDERLVPLVQKAT